MKKLLCLVLAIVVCVFLAACGGEESTQGDGPVVESAPLDLTGEWKQTNSDSKESWQSATIDESTITVYWVSDNGNTKSLYWAGTYVAPETASEPYSWESVNDTEQTSMALLASGDDEKTFTYEDGQINYEVSAFGTTTTIKLEKQ